MAAPPTTDAPRACHEVNVVAGVDSSTVSRGILRTDRVRLPLVFGLFSPDAVHAAYVDVFMKEPVPDKHVCMGDQETARMAVRSLFEKRGIALPHKFSNTHTVSFSFNSLISQSSVINLPDTHPIQWCDVLYTIECELRAMFDGAGFTTEVSWLESFGEIMAHSAHVDSTHAKTVLDALTSCRTNRIRGVGLENSRRGHAVFVLRCGGQCGPSATLKGVTGTWPQPEADIFMVEHLLLHHPEWCRSLVREQTSAEEAAVDVARDQEEFALVADRPKEYTKYVGVMIVPAKSKTRTYSARCHYCANRQEKKGAVIVRGAHGYHTDVEAAIAFGKHVQTQHEEKFQVLSLRSKKAKLWEQHSEAIAAE
jgi:hypothetical protein